MGRNEAVLPESESQHAGKQNEQHQNLPAVQHAQIPPSARRNSAVGPFPAEPQLSAQGSSRRLSALPVVAPAHDIDPVGPNVMLTASSGFRGDITTAPSPRASMTQGLGGTQALQKQDMTARRTSQVELPMRVNLQTTAPMPFNGTQQMPMINPRKSVSHFPSTTGSLTSAMSIRTGATVGGSSSGSSSSGKLTTHHTGRRKGNMTMGVVTMAQADLRMANATLQDKRQLGACKAFVESSFEEQLVHPALAHITLRSRQHRGRQRSKEEIQFLTHSLTKVTLDDPNLHTLKASSERLPGHWLSGLGRALPFNTHMRKVMWNNNDVDDGDVEALCRSMGLGGNQSVLQLTLGSSRLSDVAAYSLSRMLLGNDSLMTLNLSGKKPSVFSLTDKAVLPGISALGAGFLSEALDFNSSLTSLVVSQHKMWDAGAAAIARALRVNYSLTHLVLKSNRIGDPGAEALGLALAQNTALTSLDLSDNRIGDGGTGSLCEGLRCNKTLKHLDVCGNLIGDGGMQALFLLLANHNPYLIGLGLADNPAGVEAVERVDALLRRRHTVDLVRHTFNHARTQLDQFKDSNVIMVNTRTYPKDSTPLPYRYPTAAPLKYPALPSANPDRDEPPVCVVTRENFRIRQRMERAAIGRTKGFRKWKTAALRAKGVVEKREWFPAAETWQQYKSNLMRTYPMGIDRPGQPDAPPSRRRSRGGRSKSRERSREKEEGRKSVSESPILALKALRGSMKGPPTVRPPGYMSAEEVRELARQRAKRMSQYFAKSPRDNL